MRPRATFSSSGGSMHASNNDSGGGGRAAAAVREKTSASNGAISRDTAVTETLLETPTGSSTALAASMASTLRISAPKLSDVNRSVTHPIRLLHENLMFELFQEQLRMPSPVRQSTGNSRSRRAADLSTASLSSSYAAVTGRYRGSASNGGATRSSLDGGGGGGRASISLLQTPRPTIVLYEELPPSLLDALVSVGRPSSSSPLTRATAAEFELELEQSPRASAASSSALAAPAPGTTTLPPATTAASLTIVSAAAMDGFDTVQQRDCQICFDKMDALQAHVCVTCSGSFCSTCMQWYVEFKIQDGEVSRKKLVCPAPQCTRALAEELIEAFASPEAFAKYQSFVKNQRAGVRFCPRAGCCAALDEPLFSTHRRVACSACARESCMRCGDAYHRTRLCRRVDKRYSKWKRHHNVRACPSCKSDIEKQGGCSHMKCFQCDQEFCWSCLRSWDSHDETLCLPLAFYHSRSRKYGWTTPVRFVTKTVVLGVASVVAVAGAGVAVVVLPPLIGYHLVRDSVRRKKHRRRLSGLQPPDVAPPA